MRVRMRWVLVFRRELKLEERPEGGGHGNILDGPRRKWRRAWGVTVTGAGPRAWVWRARVSVCVSVLDISVFYRIVFRYGVGGL